MINFFIKCNKWLSANMFIVVLSGLFIGSIVNIPDSPFLRNVVVALFGYMTFVTALDTSFKEFTKVLIKPWVSIWVLVLVHLVAPLTAWLVGVIFYPNDPFIRLGYLIGASIPIGVTSLMWTSLVRGNVPVSLLAVTLDTLVVPVILPLFLKIVVGKAIQLDYMHMIEELMLMVTFPSIIGMLIHDWTNGRVCKFSESFGGASAKLGIFAVIVINAAVVMPQISWNASMIKPLFVTLFVVATGYLVGFLGSLILKERTQELTLTMMFNVGIRNNACGLVIALTYFPPAVAIPMTLSILYQQPLATVITRAFKQFTPAEEC